LHWRALVLVFLIGIPFFAVSNERKWRNQIPIVIAND